MRKLYLFAAMAAMLAACSENDLTADKQVVQQNAEEGAVTFDAYTQRTTTRAGVPGILTTEGLKTGAFKTDGFGVFGYYTNSATYDQQAIPNFFYNEQVTWNDSYFEYSPIKYWPNEYGETAESEDNDKVSFFAYAPYVKVASSTGKAVDDIDTPDQTVSAGLQKWGITSLSNNSATGDPLVKYIVSFDQDKSVDLCWGVCDDVNWPTVVNGTSQQINQAVKGLPWIDVQRPAEAKTQATAAQKVKFTFKHATAQLMVKINAFVDGTDNTNSIADKTKVYVRSITFEGFATKGALNLNNTEAGPNKAYWMDWTGSNDIVTGESVTIYDGRKDGKEGTPSGIATNEKSLGLNPALIQTDETTTGVTKDLKSLFCKGSGEATAPIYVIPTNDPVKVTIAYDIETEDKKLSTYISDATTHGSSIENVITKEINFGSSSTDANIMQNGKSYLINLHLGMNSVKFDADVTEWVETSDADVDLPKNVPVFAASTATHTVTLPADVTSYTFAVSGLDGGKTIADLAASGATAIPVSYTGPTVTANAAGVALITATIAENTTVNGTNTGKIVVSDGTHSTTIKINQAPHPLGLFVESVDFSAKEIVLASTAGGIVWGTDVANPTTTDVKVLKNGAELTTVTSAAPTDNKHVQWDASGTNHKIVLYEDMQIGDVYTITIKAGEADEETVTYKVPEGTLIYPSPSISVDWTSGSVSVNNPLNFVGDGTVNVTSTQTAVATVSDGNVSAVGPGIATIEANVTGSTYQYESTTASYTLVVRTKLTAESSYTTDWSTSFNVGKEGGTGTFIVDGLDNDGGVPTLTITGAGITASLYDDSKLATEGKVTISYTVENNTGSNRSPKITVNQGNTKGGILTVNQAAGS